MPSSSNVLIAVNGFLGRTEDWSLIPDLLPSGWHLHTVDLWSEGELLGYEEWAKRTNKDLAKRFPAHQKVLLGYSMGGRLALQALIQAPKLFEGAIIVSANPGLISEDERTLRCKADEIWATKFLREEWSDLMTEWDGQAALRSPPDLADEAIGLLRLESDFNRVALAQALRTWSLGLQRDLRKDLSLLPMPIEFVTGKSDIKFTSIARDLVRIPAVAPREHAILSSAGHRVPWDAPSQFRAVLANFLARW